MWLQVVLLLDSAVLVALGASLIFAPAQVSVLYGFGELPRAVHHLVGLWGCALITLGVGYFIAATNPRRHVVMVQIGIGRGVLELLLGLWHVAAGVVTFPQAATGMVAGAAVAVAYAVLYPRPPVLTADDEAGDAPQDSGATAEPESG